MWVSSFEKWPRSPTTCYGKLIHCSVAKHVFLCSRWNSAARSSATRVSRFNTKRNASIPHNSRPIGGRAMNRMFHFCGLLIFFEFSCIISLLLCNFPISVSHFLFFLFMINHVAFYFSRIKLLVVGAKSSCVARGACVKWGVLPIIALSGLTCYLTTKCCCVFGISHL